MSVEKTLEGIEVLLLDIRKRLEGLEGKFRPEPTVLSFPKAALRLGVGLTKLKDMVKKGQIRASKVGEVKMISLSEIHRVSAPPAERAKVETKSRREAWVPIPVGRSKR